MTNVIVCLISGGRTAWSSTVTVWEKTFYARFWYDGKNTNKVSELTFHRWRNQYGGMKAQEAKHLKELEIENRRLKKAVADLILDKQILEEVLKGK